MTMMPTTMNPMMSQGSMFGGFPLGGNANPMAYGAQAQMGALGQNLSTSMFGSQNQMGMNAVLSCQMQMDQMMMQMMAMMMELMATRGQGGGSSASSGGESGGAGSVGSSSPASSSSAVSSPNSTATQNKVSQFAQSAEGKPYVYGAAGPNSFDCSGLSMKSWAQVGTKLPHNANAQYQALPKVPIADAQVGDLVFFSGSDGNSTNPGHVGIVIDPKKHLMVSASTDGVALSKQIPVQNYMDEKGVYATVGRPVAGKNYT